MLPENMCAIAATRGYTTAFTIFAAILGLGGGGAEQADEQGEVAHPFHWRILRWLPVRRARGARPYERSMAAAAAEDGAEGGESGRRRRAGVGGIGSERPVAITSTPADQSEVKACERTDSGSRCCAAEKTTDVVPQPLQSMMLAQKTDSSPQCSR